MTDNSVVLPDTLVAQLIENAATLSTYLQRDFEAMSAQRGALRARLIGEQKIISVNTSETPLEKTFAIDGAHLAEIDRASAYSASCAVRVGQSNQANDQSSCLATLPHIASLNTLSSGLMLMQEIMMAVKVVEEIPDAVCLIDGSRISAIIAINSLYAGVERDLPNQLHNWRQQATDEPDREPGRTLSLFESRNWLASYLTHPRIVGNLKLVTTTIMVSEYIPLREPDAPFHITDGYPFYLELNRRDGIGEQITRSGSPTRLYHIYYKPDSAHGVFKIELNESFRADSNLLSGLFSWWWREIQAPDLQEPYSYYIADRFAKEAVSVAKNALKEIARRDASNASWAWFFTQPYRTE